MTSRRSNFLFRFKLKKGEIASHWGSVSFRNCLFTSLKFGHNKVDTIPDTFNFPTRSKSVWGSVPSLKVLFKTGLHSRFQAIFL